MNALLLALLLVQDPSRALEEARRELADERERIRKEDAAQEADLVEAKKTLAKLSDEVVDRTVALAKGAKELDALRAERSRLRTARASSHETWLALHRSATEARIKMTDLASALPPSEAREGQKALLEKAKGALQAVPGEPFDLAPLLQAARSLLDEARSTALFSHTVRNAEGVAEEARVLRAGMIFHAYQTVSSGRVGEVFAAPSGSAGYRWSVSLTSSARDEVRQAIAAAAAPGTALEIPLDVTQRLSPDRRDEGKGLFAILRAGGLVMIPLGLISILAAAVILERLYTLSARSGSSEAAVEAVLDRCRAGDGEEALRLAEAGKGTTMRALAAALRERSGGRTRMEEAVQESMLLEMPVLERFLPILAVLAGVAPMLGLLGTVTGMITTFDMIRLFGSGDPGVMAGGISEALVATATGLIVAIPLLLFHSGLSGRVDRILGDAQRHSTALVALFGDASKEAFHAA